MRSARLGRFKTRTRVELKQKIFHLLLSFFFSFLGFFFKKRKVAFKVTQSAEASTRNRWRDFERHTGLK